MPTEHSHRVGTNPQTNAAYQAQYHCDRSIYSVHLLLEKNAPLENLFRQMADMQSTSNSHSSSQEEKFHRSWAIIMEYKLPDMKTKNAVIWIETTRP